MYFKSFKKFYFILFFIFFVSNIFAKIDEDLLKEKISSMSLKEKVGQLFMGIIYGESLNERAKEFIDKTSLGNFIYFNWANSLKNPSQVKNLSNELKNYVFQKTKIYPLIAIDQEGGRVTRLKENFSKIKSNGELGKGKDTEKAYLQGKTVGEELSSVGINLNLAPVVDISERDRSFANDRDVVISFAREMIRGFRRGGILATLKHFPGIGSAFSDPHFDLPILNKTKDEMETFEMKPFICLKEDADLIMVSHVLVPSLDDENIAAFSKKILKDILREKYNFEKVIISDSLVMRGVVENQRNLEEVTLNVTKAAVKAFNAGCDLMILSSLEFSDFKVSREDDYRFLERVISGFKEAIENKNISEKRVNESVYRILKVKNKIF
jgi:beta-N-acetylhexosaminidase